MILKPFMLRRTKKDVESELSDKIEVMVYCPLTTRQRKLYASLKRQIRIEDLLQYAGGNTTDASAAASGIDKSVTSNLMNLVMQFRKVCNHPELFERRDARSPWHMRTPAYVVPRLLGEQSVSSASRERLLRNTMSCWRAANVQRSLFPTTDEGGSSRTFSFARFCQLETVDVERLAHEGLLYR